MPHFGPQLSNSICRFSSNTTLPPAPDDKQTTGGNCSEHFGRKFDRRQTNAQIVTPRRPSRFQVLRFDRVPTSCVRNRLGERSSRINVGHRDPKFRISRNFGNYQYFTRFERPPAIAHTLLTISNAAVTSLMDEHRWISLNYW